ncbi:MAG: hypothetical protein SGI99_17695 [Pseudomonadota bacterium]|nr:hypothetical protein [Pseudomonadota bacterium]
MKSIALSLLIVGLISTANPLLANNRAENQRITVVAAPDPAEQIRDLARLLRSNDLAGLIQATVPPSHYAQIRQAYELHRMQPITEKERAEFAEGLGKLSAPDAVDRLMIEIEPKLVEARPKVPAAVMMGLGALQIAVLSDDNHLTTAQRASLQQALPGVQQWASTTDFLSSLSMRQALTLIADAVRNTGIRSVDELKLMSFEQVLAKAEYMVAASKQALLIYGLDLNAIADSIQVEVLAINGSTARVRTTVTVFDAPIAAEHDLVLLDGRWYGREAVEHWSKHTARHAQG